MLLITVRKILQFDRNYVHVSHWIYTDQAVNNRILLYHVWLQVSYTEPPRLGKKKNYHLINMIVSYRHVTGAILFVTQEMLLF